MAGVRILRDRLPECPAGAREAELARWCEALVWEVAQEQIPPRRNRVNPRVVKRKMSRFAKKRPHHRGRPPLTNTFRETVVMA